MQPPPDAVPGSESPRVERARRHAESARLHERGLLTPLGWALMAIVALTTVTVPPRPGLSGEAGLVSVALLVYLLGVAIWMTERFGRQEVRVRVGLTCVMAGAGIALSALEPAGASNLAASATVWMAVSRLPRRPGVCVATLTTAGLGLADAISGVSTSGVLASMLLCVLLGLMAHFMKHSRESQERTEVLLAELQDAREGLAEAAASGERARIASELHDVLAHALSGAAIQLQGAKLLAERQDAEPQLRVALERASELVKDGLGDARRAVGALRGDRLPAVEELGELLETFRTDMGVEATLAVEGTLRKLSAEVSLALYRGAQEALTNVARHAPGAATSVLLRYDRDRTTLTVEDRATGGPPRPGAGELADVGGGRGLDGMRERLERAGGRVDAGPTGTGWRVRLEVPA
jgi:signal transduction histidine kinase